MVFGGSYNKHQAKCWKKNKCKRMIRVLGKRPTPKDYGSGTDVVLFFGGRDEEEDEEMERKREQQKERAERNKKWRERRDMEQNGDPEDTKDYKVDKDERNRRMQDELTCSNCRTKLEGEVWQCRNGHLTCLGCFDKDQFLTIQRENEDELTIQNMGLHITRKTDTDDGDSLLSDTASKVQSSLNSEKDVNLWGYNKGRKLLSNGTLSTDSSVRLEEGSYIRPPIEELDFEANTLDIRKDAIVGYDDYNAYLTQKDDEEDVIDFNFPSHEKESDDEGTFVSEETFLPDYEESVKDLQLHPKTLSQLILEESFKEDEEKKREEKVKKRMMKLIKKIDFFANTLKIRKDAIETYSDYNGVDEGVSSEEDDDDDTSTIVDDENNFQDEIDKNTKILNCKICNEPIDERNGSLEKLVSLFNNMMLYRNKLVQLLHF